LDCFPTDWVKSDYRKSEDKATSLFFNNCHRKRGFPFTQIIKLEKRGNPNDYPSIQATPDGFKNQRNTLYFWHSRRNSLYRYLSTSCFNLHTPPRVAPDAANKPASPHPSSTATGTNAANIYHSALQLGFDPPDYADLLAFLKRQYSSYQAFLYTGLDSTNLQQKRLLFRLQNLGYKIISKEIIKRADGSCKANLYQVAFYHVILSEAKNLDRCFASLRFTAFCSA
jgi:hypothetical protein